MSEPRDRDWLLARERGEDVSQVPAQTRARYGELERLIEALPGQSPSPGWKQRVLDRLDAPVESVPRVSPVRRRRRWAIAGAAIAAAAAIAVILAWRAGILHRPATDVIVMTETRRAGQPHRGGVGVGDTWIVRVEADRPIELRVYGDAGEPLARCAAGEACTVTQDGERRRLVLEAGLGAPGDARAVVFEGGRMPSPRNLEADLAEAQRLGIDAHQVAVVHVQ
jgi:hypothetical protein